jgi:hypothetical protein
MVRFVRRSLPMLVMGAVLVTMLPAHAVTKTLHYNTSAIGLTSSEDDPTCAAGCKIAKDSDNQIHFGGVYFTPAMLAGKTLVTVYARDDNAGPLGMRISLSWCQDLDDNISCGEKPNSAGVNEMSGSGCVGSTAATGAAITGINPAYDLAVFVRTAWGCPTYVVPDAVDEDAVATSGTVTISY